MLPDLALSSTLMGSNHPCVELIFMVPKVFEPLKFDCTCARKFSFFASLIGNYDMLISNLIRLNPKVLPLGARNRFYLINQIFFISHNAPKIYFPLNRNNRRPPSVKSRKFDPSPLSISNLDPPPPPTHTQTHTTHTHAKEKKYPNLSSNQIVTDFFHYDFSQIHRGLI